MTRDESPTAARRGYALPIVIGLSLLLSTALTVTLLSLIGAVGTGEALLHRRQAFHAAEGVSLAALELATKKLRELPQKPPLPETDPGFAAAQAALLESNRQAAQGFVNDPSNRALFTPAGYELLSPHGSGTQVLVNGLGVPTLKELDSGPFAGMQALVQPMNLAVGLRRVHDRTPAVQLVVANVETATMSMFQFYVFSDLYLDLDPGGPVLVKGRIHTNGDFCVAGQPTIDTVTAAGNILMSNRTDQRCRRRATEENDIRIATSNDFASFATLTFDHDTAGWAALARTTFNNHVLDSAHGVSVLKMPLSGTPRVQAGSNVLAMEQTTNPGDPSRLVPVASAKEDNTTAMRFLVDPMLVTEPAGVREQKFAFKADIRIIDGVWFLRDPLHPEEIGTPIWSDHPGRGSASYDGNPSSVITTRMIGQADVAALHGWNNGGTIPEGYSYYSFESDEEEEEEEDSALTWARSGAGPRAVVSYGLLHTTTDGGGNRAWVPGHYATPPTSTAAGVTAASTSLQHFLDGARSGFKDGWLETRSESLDAPPGDDSAGDTAIETRRSRLLPINFDIAAFLDMLQRCAPGQHELGTHFRGSCNGNKTERVFNGIVYVSSTWPGMMDGLGDTPATSGFATLSPFHGEGGGAADPGLPMPLCYPGTNAAPDIANPAAPSSSVAPGLTRCDQMGRGAANQSFPNVLRLFNAEHINPAANVVYTGITIRKDVLPKGLTIATNLPVVLMGNANVDTTPQRLAIDPLPANDHFVPFLVAGDRFYRFSRDWNDGLANWVQPMDANVRVGVETTQNNEILAGWNPTPSTPLSGHDHSSDGVEDFPRYLECWSGTMRYSGSIVIGFASVLTRSGANNGEGDARTSTACFPSRDEGYDFHLEDPRNQPPGAPQILAQSTTSWTAR